jgi:hypothetical protein
MTLVLAAMGIEILIAAAQPKLGRDLFLANSIVYLIGLILKAKGTITTFDSPDPERISMLFVIYNFIGLGSIAACGWLTIKTKQLLTEWLPLLILFGCWLLGTAFYFYMPLASMTNPPMNWGYPRTWDGFIHAFTRGQYERPIRRIFSGIRFALKTNWLCFWMEPLRNTIPRICSLVCFRFSFTGACKNGSERG